MWLEVKATITVVGCFILFIAMFLANNIIIIILGLMGIMTMIFGDIILGWKMISTDAVNLLDPNGPGERTVDLHLIGGGRRILKGKKGLLGKIEFVFAGTEASVIDDGRHPIRFANGNAGVIAHESYDKNINMNEVKFLEKASKDLNEKNIIGMRKKILERRKETDGKT